MIIYHVHIHQAGHTVIRADILHGNKIILNTVIQNQNLTIYKKKLDRFLEDILFLAQREIKGKVT